MSTNYKKDIMSSFRINADDNVRKSFVLRCEGYTYKEIADMLGFKYSQYAHRCVKRAYKKFSQEMREEMKNAALAAMQAKLRECNKIATKTKDPSIKLKAVDTYRKLMIEINKICGNYAPEKSEMEIKGEPIIKLVDKEWDEIL